MDWIRIIAFPNFQKSFFDAMINIFLKFQLNMLLNYLDLMS